MRPPRRAALMVIRVMPSPSRVLTSDVRRQAARSSAASCSASCCSATSGATTSSTRRPSPRSSRGPKCAASATRCASAWAQHLGRHLVGGQLVQRVRDHPRLRQVDLARRPARSRPVAHRRSSDSASTRSRRLAPPSVRVWCVTRRPTSRAPSSSATSSEAAITRSRNAASCASTRASCSRAARLSSGSHEGDLDVDGLLQRGLDRVGARQHRVERRRSNVVLTAHLLHRLVTMTDWFSRSMQRACEQADLDRGPGRSLSITIGSNLCSIVQGHAPASSPQATASSSSESSAQTSDAGGANRGTSRRNPAGSLSSPSSTSPRTQGSSTSEPTTGHGSKSSDSNPGLSASAARRMARLARAARCLPAPASPSPSANDMLHQRVHL